MSELRKLNAKEIADKIYYFSIDEAEKFAKSANDLVSLIMLANLKHNGWYSCKIDGVKVYFEKID